MQGAIGIDAGCTNVKAVAVDHHGGVIVSVEKPTGSVGLTHSQVSHAVLRELLDKLDADAHFALGVASPGLASADGRCIAVLPGRETDLEGIDWTQLLNWPTHVPVLNDAHAALLGEAWCGAAMGYEHVVLLTLGTGVGGALMMDGRLVRGNLGRAGHMGHISLNLDGEPGIMNTPGALENYLAETTIRQRTDGRYESNYALLTAARQGETQAQQHWQRMVRALAVGIASLINVVDPQLVVLGGGLAQAGEALYEPLNEQLALVEWRPTGSAVPIVPAKLGRFAGAIGAARQAMMQQSSNRKSDNGRVVTH